MILADRDQQTLSEGTETIRSAGHNAIGRICDVTDRAQVTTMVEKATVTYGAWMSRSTMPVSTATARHCWTRATANSTASSTSTYAASGTA